jgi:hypothetical protein
MVDRCKDSIEVGRVKDAKGFSKAPINELDNSYYDDLGRRRVIDDDA